MLCSTTSTILTATDDTDDDSDSDSSDSIHLNHNSNNNNNEMGAPNQENRTANNGNSSSKGIKTVYLIRHAESHENRRRHSLTRCFEQISTGAIPSSEDLNASFELLNVPENLNSGVSTIGAKQIEHMGGLLENYNFLEEKGVQLVVHSPLLRARQTCEGLLGVVATKSIKMKVPLCVKRVEELDFLVERQPQEIPQEVILKDVPPSSISSSFTKRIKDFEQWLVQQPEDTIAVVGHSLHFKSMLKVNFKFKNCEVWVAQFDPKNIAPLSPAVSLNFSAAARRHSLLLPPLPPLSQTMKQMNPFVAASAKQHVPPAAASKSSTTPPTSSPSTSSPWSDLKRVYSCEVSRASSSPSA